MDTLPILNTVGGMNVSANHSYISFVEFSELCYDSAVLTVGLGLGTKPTWLGFWKRSGCGLKFPFSFPAQTWLEMLGLCIGNPNCAEVSFKLSTGITNIEMLWSLSNIPSGFTLRNVGSAVSGHGHRLAGTLHHHLFHLLE